jgi:hypothetical protein
MTDTNEDVEGAVASLLGPLFADGALWVALRDVFYVPSSAVDGDVNRWYTSTSVYGICSIFFGQILDTISVEGNKNDFPTPSFLKKFFSCFESSAARFYYNPN